jgi:hypothetical protein
MKKRSIVSGFILVLCLFAIFAFDQVVIRGPKLQNAELSQKIFREIVGFTFTNLPNAKITDMTSEARNEATLLYVRGELSDKEKQELKLIVEKISQENGGQKVEIYFK